MIRSKHLLPILLALCIVRLWLMALPSSFWIDETATVFVVRHGADDPSFHVAPQVPDSLYYWLPRVSTRLFGQSEVAYRLPSILAAALALWLIARLAMRLIHPEAGWFAAFACLALHDFNEHAVDARPYALGICVAAACVWFLVRWLDSGAWRDALLFACCAAILWPIHLIYWPFYIVLALYAVVRRGVPALQAVLVCVLIALALVPVALRALTLMHHAAAHVILALPSLHHFEWTLRWKLPLIAGAAAWILGRVLKWPCNPQALTRSTLVLAVAWWLVQPVSLFAYSYLTGNSAYVPRYFSISLPGLALVIVCAVRPFLPATQWKPMAALVGIGALLLLGQWSTVWPEHQHSDWRSAADLVNKQAPDATIPVICTSPYIEAQGANWRPDYPLPGFLYTHVSVYPLRGKLLLFPFERDPMAEAYAAAILPDTIIPAGRFVIYGGAGNVRDWRTWFARRPELTGWENRLIRFGDVYVVLYSRPSGR